MKTYIGIDLGTSSVKLLLMNGAGEVMGSACEAYPVSYPRPGWSEQDPEDWYRATVVGIRRLMQGQDAGQVQGIGVAGQMHGLVLADRAGRILRPAILWNDGRSAVEAAELNRTVGGKRLIELTGNIAYAGFTLPKLMWVRKHEPEIYRQIGTVLLPKDELVRRLTGVSGTEPSDACGTLLYDVRRGCWSEEMRRYGEIPPDWLPPVRRSEEKVGTLLPEVAAETGLPAGVYVVAGAGDNAAASLGIGTVSEGSCSISLGTSGTVLIPCGSGQRLCLPTLHTFLHADGSPILLGCILTAASAGGWWIDDILGSGDYAHETETLGDGQADDPYFLPYLMGERSPHNDPDAKGVFFGMQRSTSRAAMTRAVYEGVTYALRDCMEEAGRIGIRPTSARLCGGGARSEAWCRMIADALGLTVEVPLRAEGPSLGAAMLAAVADGAATSVREAAEKWKQDGRVYQPNPDRAAFYRRRYGFWRRLYPALQALFGCEKA